MKKNSKILLTLGIASLGSIALGSCQLFGSDSLTATFYTNGGSAISPISVQFKETLVLPDNPTKTGYSFAGWFVDEGLTNPLTDAMLVVRADLNLYASWTANSYTVTFDSKGGTTVEQITDEFGKTITPTRPTKAGYTFAGWYTDSGTKNAFNNKITSSNITVYAKWSANSLLVKYNKGAEDATGSMADQTIETGNGTPLTANSFSRVGYTFAGWEDTLNEKTYTDEEIISLVEASKTIELKAKWLANNYTISFIDGQSEAGKYQGAYGSKVEVPDTIKASPRTGYKFEGWGTYAATVDETFKAPKLYYVKSTSGNVDVYTQASVTYGAPVTGVYYELKEMDSNLTVASHSMEFVAIFSANKLSLTIDYDGAKANETLEKYTNETLIAPEDPTKEGYTFVGWVDSQGNATAFDKMGNENRTIKAKFVANKYTLSFDVNASGVTDVESLEDKDFGSKVNLPAAPIRNGYDFVGWSDGTTTYDAEDEYTISSTKDVAFTALWSAKTVNYTVKHIIPSIDGTSTSVKETEQLSGKVDENTAAAYKDYTGFTQGGTIVQVKIAYDGTTEIELVYTRNTYKVTFVDDENEEIKSYDVKYEDKLIKANLTGIETDPTMNYSYIDSSSNEFSFDTAITGNITIKVVPSLKEALTLEIRNSYSDDDSLNTHSQNLDSFDVTLPSTFTRTGYTFKGYSSTENGEVEYDAGATYSVSANTYLYCVWEVNQYTITYKVDGQTDVVRTINYGEAISAETTPTKEGYTFRKWDISIPTNMPAENLVATALFKVNTYTVTFDVDGGLPIGPREYEFGTAASNLPSPSRVGYSFAGWYVNENQFATVGAANVTVKAKWNKLTYTYTFKVDGQDDVVFADMAYGSTYDVPTNPIKDNAKFLGWEDEEGNVYQTLSNTIGHTDKVFTAVFSTNRYNVVFLNRIGGEKIATSHNESETYESYIQNVYDRMLAYEFVQEGVEKAIGGNQAQIASAVGYATFFKTIRDNALTAVLTKNQKTPEQYASLREDSAEKIRLNEELNNAVESYLKGEILKVGLAAGDATQQGLLASINNDIHVAALQYIIPQIPGELLPGGSQITYEQFTGLGSDVQAAIEANVTEQVETFETGFFMLNGFSKEMLTKFVMNANSISEEAYEGGANVVIDPQVDTIISLVNANYNSGAAIKAAVYTGVKKQILQGVLGENYTAMESMLAPLINKTEPTEFNDVLPIILAGAKIDQATYSYLLTQTDEISLGQIAAIQANANELILNLDYSLSMIDLAMKAFDYSSALDYDYVNQILTFANSPAQSEAQDAASSAISDMSLQYEALYQNAKANAYNPVRDGYAFNGWSSYTDFTGTDDCFYVYKVANWLYKQATPDNVYIDNIKNSQVTVNWDTVEGAWGYEIVFEDDNEYKVKNEVEENSNIVTENYAIISGLTADSSFKLHVIAIAKDEFGNMIRASKDEYATATAIEDGSTINVEGLPMILDSDASKTIKYTHTIVGDVKANASGEFYYVGGENNENLYLFENTTYNFAEVDEYEVSSSDYAVLSRDEDSRVLTITTKGVKNKSSFTLTKNGKVINVVVYPKLSEITLGDSLQAYVNTTMSSGENKKYLGSVEDPYLIGGSSESEVLKGYSTSYVVTPDPNNPAQKDYYYNGYRFDFEILTSSGHALKASDLDIEYSFESWTGSAWETVTEPENLYAYDEENDTFYFKPASGKYRVTLAPKVDVEEDKANQIDGYTNLTIPQAFKANPISKSFEFTLNDGANITSDIQLKKAFNDGKINAINIHNNINATLTPTGVAYTEYAKAKGSINQYLIGDDKHGDVDIKPGSAVMVKGGSQKIWVRNEEQPASGFYFQAKDGYYYTYSASGQYSIESAKWVENQTSGKFKILGELTSKESFDYAGGFTSDSCYQRYSTGEQDEKGYYKGSDVTVNGNYFTIYANDLENIPYFVSTDVIVGSGASIQKYVVQHSLHSVFDLGDGSNVKVNNMTVIGNTENASAFLAKDTGVAGDSIANYMSKTSGGIDGFHNTPVINPDNYKSENHENLCLHGVPTGTFDLNNINVSNTVIALYNDYWGTMNISYGHIKDSWANSFMSWAGDMNSVSNSIFESSGGAAQHMQEDWYSYNKDQTISNTKLLVDFSSTTYTNFVGGEEQWFKAYSMEVTALGMKSMVEDLVSANGFTILQTVVDPITKQATEKMNLVYLGKNDTINSKEKDEFNNKEEWYPEVLFGTKLMDIPSQELPNELKSIPTAMYQNPNSDNYMLVATMSLNETVPDTPAAGKYVYIVIPCNNQGQPTGTPKKYLYFTQGLGDFDISAMMKLFDKQA